MSNIVRFDFEGRLYSFNTDGWFNATEAAKRYGKRVQHWLDNAETQEYIRILNSRISGDLIVARRGANGGTWLHPKLAVVFARWLKIEFAVWCDEQIDSIIRNGIRAQGNTDLIPLLLRPDAAEWELRFTPGYYQALARVTRTKYTGHSGGTPALYGALTERWVYGCLLPKDVHKELKTRRHESEKMHQWLTAGGRELLDKQIALVASIASTSADLRDFEARMMMVSSRGGQLGFIYPRAA